MTDDVHRISVKIGGMNYQLLAAENETYIRQVAAHADEMIHRVMQNNPQLNLSMATVLALVNAVDELHHAFNEQQNSRKLQEEAERNSAEVKVELGRLREQIWEIKKKLLHSQELCKNYEEMIDRSTAPIGSKPEPFTAQDMEQSGFESEPIPEPWEESGDHVTKEVKENQIEDEPTPLLHEFEQTRLDDYLPGIDS